MRVAVACLMLGVFALGGCVYDFEGAKARAIATAQDECRKRGGTFVLISVEKHEDKQDLSVIGHCEHPDSEQPKPLSNGADTNH